MYSFDDLPMNHFLSKRAMIVALVFVSRIFLKFGW